MDSFKNESVKELLDSNDHIRRVLGGKDLYLIPSVVVVGAQSHGKSSVLEMLSSVKLPSGSGMVTKRPLSIELRRSKTPGESLYFRPRDCENEWQIQRDEVEGLVKEESLKSDREQLSQNNKTGIVDLPMTLRIEGENLMDVTLIDLPGIKYDDGQAESRIKELIRNRIKAESSIILVVHNASVDTDTNEGFKMAKEVDPSGHRTLTVLTHVDTILDPLTMDQQVISYLKKTTCNFYAVCCPSASEHAAITHDEAKAKEQLFFDTHDSLKPLATQTGSTNLVRKVALMYRSAVEASQKPLEEAIRSKRINITRSIRLLPETQSPSVRFGHLWSKMVTEFQMILDGSNGSIDLHHQLHVTCTSLQISLLKVPLKLLNKHESLEPLMLVLGTIDGRMLPNFNPFKPLEKFTAERMRLHFGQAVKKIQHVIDDQFVSSEKVILPTILRGVPECMADKYKQCLELMTDEVHFVLEMTIQKIADRMQDRVLDEVDGIWTSNNHYYNTIRAKLFAAMEQTSEETSWEAKVSEILNGKYDWKETNPELKARTTEYFFAFCAYWKVAVRAFVDGVGKSARREIQSIPQYLRDHLSKINEMQITRAFDSFLAVDRERQELSDELEQLEKAHMILLGLNRPPLLSERLFACDDVDVRNRRSIGDQDDDSDDDDGPSWMISPDP